MGPRFVRLAGILYGALVLAAVLWNGLRGRELFLLGPVLSGLALGVVVACVTIFLGLLVYRLVPVMRSIADELAPQIIDGARRRDLILVSVFSGVGEEVFFRGALQPEVGLVAASIIFGLVHIGPDRRYLVWTAWALFAGFLFGAIYELAGGLLAPMIAHSLHNATTFLLWKWSWERR